MTTQQAQAKQATREFQRWLAQQWGRPDFPMMQSAMFEQAYPNGNWVAGWHGYRSRGFGELCIVFDVRVGRNDAKVDTDTLSRWSMQFDDEALAQYRDFLARARATVTQTPILPRIDSHRSKA